MGPGRTFVFLLISFCAIRCTPPSVLSNKEILLGDELANQYEFTQAISHYQKFCKINSNLGLYRNYDRESDVLRKIAYSFSMIGKFKNALVSLTEAARIDSATKNTRNLLDDLRCIGNCYLYMGDYKTGLIKLNECLLAGNKLEASLKQTNREVAANVYLSLGNCYAVLSQYDTSNLYLNKAVKIFQDEGDNYGLMTSLLKLGMNDVDLSEYNSGKRFIDQSKEIACNLKLSTSEHWLAIGNIYAENGDFEQALHCKKHAIVQADSSGNISQLIVCNISLGDLYMEIGDEKSALVFYNKANNVLSGNEVEKKDAAAILATRKGDFTKSLNFYNESGATFSKNITLLKISISYFERKRYDSCLYYLSKTDNLIPKSIKNETKSLIKLYKAAALIESGVNYGVAPMLDSALFFNQNPDNKWKILYYTGRLQENLNDFNAAENTYKNAIKIIEDIRSQIQSDEIKNSFMDKRIEVYDRLIILLNKQGKAEESFNYAEKARNRAFLDMLARQKQSIAFNKEDSSFASIELKLDVKLKKLKEKISSLSDTAENHNELANQARNYLEKQLAETNTDYDKFISLLQRNNNKLVQLIKPEVADVNAVISMIDNNTVLLEYWLSSDKLFIWSIDKSGVTMVESPYDITKTDIINKCLESISRKSKQSTYYLSELYKILIAPIKTKLHENCNLIIVPHGVLHFIPFHALTDERNSSLVQHYYVSYVPSASIFKENRKDQREKGNSILAMAIGNLSVSGMPALASTISEVEKITPLFENSVSRIGQECTIDYFTTHASFYSYIHLATHGIYNNKSPFSSYIQFNKTGNNEGKLKVSDIFGLRLNSNLVTLSACQTALGNISNSDELVGLSRAFMYAGTPAIVVSLWNVADEPTSKLMTYFYENLKTKPTNIALTLAQRKLMVNYSDPYYWSPFVLIGNTD